MMSNESTNLTRRKFMIAGSAAIASPLLFSAAGSMVGTKTAEAKIAKGTKIYFIGDGCIGCQACWAFCPVRAIHFGDTGNEIDQDKCIHCGTCYKECPISVVTETEI
jgi:ferredoxin